MGIIHMRTSYSIKSKKNYPVYVLLVLFFFFGTCLMLVYPKQELFLIMNSWHSDFLDLLFPYITYLGDGGVVALFVIFFLFWKLGYVFDFLMSVLLSNIFIQGGKHWLFDDAARPKGLLGPEAVHLIEGVKVHSMHTFPSGHSATAMFMYFFLAIVLENKQLKVLCILTAFLAGYSRIYLSQHFFTDVFAGFLISVVCVLAIMTTRNKIGEPHWFEKSILKF